MNVCKIKHLEILLRYSFSLSLFYSSLILASNNLDLRPNTFSNELSFLSNNQEFIFEDPYHIEKQLMRKYLLPVGELAGGLIFSAAGCITGMAIGTGIVEIGTFGNPSYDAMNSGPTIGGIITTPFAGALGVYCVGKFIGKEKRSYSSALVGAMGGCLLSSALYLHSRTTEDQFYVEPLWEMIWIGLGNVILSPLGATITYNIL